MNKPIKNPSDDARALHDDILSYIEQADALLAKDEIAPLGGLDTAVEDLCGRILALEPETAKQFAPRLETLLAKLGGLQQHMQAALLQCKASMDELNKRQRASKAYQPPKE